MYMETRKRTPGKTYKTSEVNIDQIEFKDRELLGRCSKKVKGHSKSSVIIPDEFLQPYRDEIVKDTIAGVLKMFEHLPSDVLALIASSFENRLANQLGFEGAPVSWDDCQRKEKTRNLWIFEGTWKTKKEIVEGPLGGWT
ncbi:hypothetical protein PHJA_002459700 [Phtheirospermum japonicum]|uniref:Uncharacterized protein n=1 Tax=Phtheirospermum japonicum TaxID=374723 RepID=A0A830D021_9LAMI|nr:hypothetical protein PHJA_002459700 [Phtheirospermum japonicum]